MAIPEDDLRYVEAWLRAGDATARTETGAESACSNGLGSTVFGHRDVLRSTTIEQPSSPFRRTDGCGLAIIDLPAPVCREHRHETLARRTRSGSADQTLVPLEESRWGSRRQRLLQIAATGAAGTR